MRNKTEIASILQQTAIAFESEFGVLYKEQRGILEKGFDEILQERVRKFLFKRLSHLPDVDFLSLKQLYSAVPDPLYVEPSAKKTEENKNKKRST